MENNTGVKSLSALPALPILLLAMVCLGTCEWVIIGWFPQGSPPLVHLGRVLLASALIALAWHINFRRQKNLNERLAKLLVKQENLNKLNQQELREREVAQHKLSDQLEFLQILIDAIPAPIFYKDSEGIYSGCNRAFEAFLGKPRDQIVGHSVYGVSPGPQARVYHEKDLELMRQRGHQTYESQVVYADGTLHDVIFNKAAYELEDGRLGGLIGVILDISERKALERDLLQAKETAEFYSRSKTQFLTNMSHEIRTPLNAIVGFSQILQNRTAHLSPTQDFHDFLQKISISGQRLADLVNDVLDISRIEAGKIEVIEEDFALQNLINCILASCEPQAYSKHLKISSHIDSTLPKYIRMDRGKVSQVLINLTANAIKFSPERSEVKIELFNRTNTHIVIEVSDQGIGIPPEQQAIIFEPFEQVDKTLDGQAGGTGLGLPITRRLVELLGGEIELNSAKNAGTCFKVILPLCEGHPIQAAGEEVATPQSSFEGVQVLIFEDNMLNQALMQAFCDDLNITATFADDAYDGLKKAQAMRPDLIFMDVQLPGLSGIEATKQIRNDPVLRDTPVIGLSAAAFSDQQNTARDAGMNDYLSKPIAFPELTEAIRKSLQ
ncbi:response regulator [Microbulbifer agarilyticus]|uniref:ATP-binding protein n=1 Tax=Microbulbifer agarilyticus TaxID=260552 RepID=UPI001C968140|nr:ATP-binding protein [Microbulbifer agarilyticus]MBY6210254.1 response regulator [Microbulbifer agarilyticus]